MDIKLLEEVASTKDGRDITRGYIMPDFLMPPQDTLLKSYHNYTIYDDILRDDQVAACFQQRRSALVSKEWEVLPGGTKRIDKYAAAAIKDMLTAIKFDDITDKMLYGLFYGFAVAECLWEQSENLITLKDIKVRDRNRFAFDGDLRLRLITSQSPNGELLPDKKFWTFSTGASHSDDPYGIGLAHWLYWPVTFKKNGIKFWLVFLEKFGMPTLKGIYEPNTTEDERSRLLEALQAIQTDSGIIIPQGMQIELIEATRGGTADYSTFLDKMQGIIAKVILSQTMTTDDGSSRAQASVHDGIAARVIKADADLICGSLNQSVVKWLTDWNFPNAAYPTVWRVLAQEEDLNERIKRDKTIFDMGFKPTMEYITQTYGGEWQAPGDTVLPVETPDNTPISETTATPVFAEATPNPLNLVDTISKEMGKIGVFDDNLKVFRDLLDKSESLEDFQKGLNTLYDDLDFGTFTILMGQALTLAELQGMASVEEPNA